MKTYRPVFTRNLIVIEVVGNIVLPLLLLSPLLLWAWTVFGSEFSFFWWFVSFVPLFVVALKCFTYILRMQWKMWMGKERWATYFQTRNSLAIKVPFQPVKFLRRQECVGFMPSGDRLLLRDGTKYKLPGVPGGDDLNLSRGEEIIKSWWPEIDIERMRARRKRKLPDRGLIIVIVVAFVFVHSILHKVLEYNDVSVAGGVESLTVNAWLIATVYILARWMLRRYDEFTFALPLEPDQETDDGRQK